MKHLLLKLWPIILLLLLTFLLRIIKLEELFYFTYDESVFAFVGRRMALWNHIPLIGGVTPFGVHVAPYFYWFFSVTLILGKLNPLSWGYTAAITAVLTTLMAYKVGELIDSRKVGFTAAIFWSFSFLANIYDRHFWGLTFGPLFSLLIIYSLYKIIKGNEKYVYVLALALAIIIHADLSYYMFAIMTVLSWVIFKIKVRKSTYIAIFLIAFSFLPLVLFDVRHNFSNTKPFLKFLQAENNSPGFDFKNAYNNFILFPKNLTRLTYTFGDNEVAKQYSYCQVFVKEKLSASPAALVGFFALLLTIFVYWALKKSKSIGWKLISVQILCYLIGIQIYGTILRADIFEHYITGIFALFLLVLAKIITILPKKVWLAAIAIFVTINLYQLAHTKNSMGLLYKKQAISYTMEQVGDGPFSLDSLSTCWKYSGYRYLFAVFGREPVKSYVDPNFGYLYGTTPIWPSHPEIVVSFVIHDFIPENDSFYKRYAILKSHEITSKLFGNIEAIIIDNSSGWFD